MIVHTGTEFIGKNGNKTYTKHHTFVGQKRTRGTREYREKPAPQRWACKDPDLQRFFFGFFVMEKTDILTPNRGTKRLVSVNICSVEGNSAGIFVSKVHVSPGIFVIKESPAAIFGRQISAAKFVEKKSVPYNFLSFEFSSAASEQIK